MALVETITLEWHGPYGFKELMTKPELKKKFSCAGVYLWKEHTADEERIAYIGKTQGSPTLFERQIQHYMGHVGGTYLIPKEFRRTGQQWAMDIDNNDVVSTILDLAKLKDLVEDGFKYAGKISIYFAPTPQNRAAVIERNLLYDINPTRTKWGTRSKPNVKLKFNHTGALHTDKLKRQDDLPEEKL